MVSRFSYPHLTQRLLRGRRRFSYVVQIVVIVFTLALFRELAVVLSFWVYALSAPLGFGLSRVLRVQSDAPPVLEERLPR